MNDVELLQAARAARANSYSPYSGFAVGAALLADSGKVYIGSNIENAAYPVTLCAERAAFAVAVSAGERAFSAIAVAGGSSLCYPCGMCRQVMAEFCAPGFRVIVEDGEGAPLARPLSALLPDSFGPSNIDKCQKL